MGLNLPVHPTRLHPLTGQPLQALYIDRHGRARWPVIGAAPEGGEGGNGEGGSGDGSGGAGSSGGEGGGGSAADDKSKGGGSAGAGDLGFPKDTPLTEMSVEQREAYWQHQARKHEDRFKGLSRAVNGKTADELKADFDELETLRRSKLTDSERAVEDAKREARAAAEAELQPKLVRTALEGRLAHLKPEERDDLIDTLDLSKFLNNGELDSDKLDKFAQRHTPSGTDKRRWPDTGQGNRDHGKTSGVSAGAEMFAEGRKKKS